MLPSRSVPNLLLRWGLNRCFEVVCNLEELKVIKTALGCFESPSNNFYFSPDVDEGFGVSGSSDLGSSR